MEKKGASTVERLPLLALQLQLQTHMRSRNITTQLENVLKLKRRPIWVLVAHRGGALLFEGQFPGRKPFRVIQKWDHPEGRLKNQDLDADQPGRSMGRIHRARHSYSEQVDSKRLVARAFARELVAKLEKGRVENRFRKFMLIAESRFLGELRACMGPALSRLQSASLEKELHLMPVGRIQALILQNLREIARENLQAVA